MLRVFGFLDPTLRTVLVPVLPPLAIAPAFHPCMVVPNSNAQDAICPVHARADIHRADEPMTHVIMHLPVRRSFAESVVILFFVQRTENLRVLPLSRRQPTAG